MLNLMTNKDQAIAKKCHCARIFIRVWDSWPKTAGIATETSNDLNSKSKKRCCGTAVLAVTKGFYNSGTTEDLAINVCNISNT